MPRRGERALPRPGQCGGAADCPAGSKEADGSGLYSDWPWVTGIEGANWRTWKLESPIPPWDNMPIIAVMGAASLAQIFTVPPTEVTLA